MRAAGLARYANLNLPHRKTRKIPMLFRNKPSNYLHAPPLVLDPLPSRPYVCVRRSARSFSPREINDDRVERKKNHRNNAIMRNQGSGGGKYPRGSYSQQPSRGLDLDFPTSHYIISTLSAGEYGENDQLAGRSERTRFGNGCIVDGY